MSIRRLEKKAPRFREFGSKTQTVKKLRAPTEHYPGRAKVSISTSSSGRHSRSNAGDTAIVGKVVEMFPWDG